MNTTGRRAKNERIEDWQRERKRRVTERAEDLHGVNYKSLAT